MEMFKRILSGLIICVLVFAVTSCLFFGCNRDNGDGTDVTTDTQETSQSTAVMEDIIKNGESDYVIIRSQNEGAELSDRLKIFRTDINEKCGSDIQVRTDWSKDIPDGSTVNSESSVHEILVGNTNRAESLSVAEQYKQLNGYVIKYVNGKLVIWGTNTKNII